MSNKSLINFLFLLIIAISFCNICYGNDLDYLDNAFESDSLFGLEEPEEFKDIDIKPESKSESETLIDQIPDLEIKKDTRVPRPIGGYGNLHIVIESIEALNHSVISKKADRVEVWLGHLLLSRLELGDVKVSEGFKSRIFDFPTITLKTGYYFISIRLYSKGVIWKNRKFHEQIYQVGVHEGQTTTLIRKIPFLNW